MHKQNKNKWFDVRVCTYETNQRLRGLEFEMKVLQLLELYLNFSKHITTIYNFKVKSNNLVTIFKSSYQHSDNRDKSGEERTDIW